MVSNIEFVARFCLAALVMIKYAAILSKKCALVSPCLLAHRVSVFNIYSVILRRF